MTKLRTEYEMYGREVGFDQKIEYSGGDAIYIGMAFPGATTNTAVWQIKKLEYTSGNMTTLRYAGGTDDFIWIWDNRALLNYMDI